MSNEDSCASDSVRLDALELVRENMPGDRDFMRFASFVKALGDFNRVRIVYALRFGELCVFELAELIGMRQSAISHQLRLLRDKGVVCARRENKHVFYSLVDDGLGDLLDSVFVFLE